MSTLFPDLFDEGPLPGLRYRAGLIAPEEAAPLIGQLEALELAPFRFQGWLGKRLTTSFGWRYDFDDASFAETTPIPDWLLPIRTRAAALADLSPDALVQLLVTRYDPGAGIGWHRDRPVFEHVVGVSLGAPATMRFRRRRADGFDRFNAPLAPGSAYHLAGEVRHHWEHSIAPMTEARWSLTFRSLSEQGRARGARPHP